MVTKVSQICPKPFFTQIKRKVIIYECSSCIYIFHVNIYWEMSNLYKNEPLSWFWQSVTVAVSCRYGTWFAVRLVMDYTTSHFTWSTPWIPADQVSPSQTLRCPGACGSRQKGQVVIGTFHILPTGLHGLWSSVCQPSFTPGGLPQWPSSLKGGFSHKGHRFYYQISVHP